MARHTLACVVALVTLSAATEQSRWSRQISYSSDLSDWVPLPGPATRDDPPPPLIKRQAIAEPRILAEPVYPGFQRPTGFTQDFPTRTFLNAGANRHLYLQSVPAVPSAPQNYLSDQGFSQGLRFELAQPNFPLNQGFVGPQLGFEPAPVKLPTNQRQKVSFVSNPITFPKTNQPTPQAKPFVNTAPKKPEGQKSVDGYRIDSALNFNSMKRPQSLQKLKYETSDKIPRTDMIPPRAKSEKEEVQLLYVPLESLNKGQFNFRSPIAAPQVIKPANFNNQHPQRPAQNPAPALPKQNYAADFQRPVAQPIDSFDSNYYPNYNIHYKELEQTQKFSTLTSPFPTTLPTTPKPKKLKAHQPPLAIFLAHDVKKQVKVGDVLSSLKNADTVAVLDSVNPETAPKVFIGPSNLAPPENFAKFELPYLSNIEHSDKKLRQLPFFVAPLSYNTPQGFAKIPFPAPHVGSVVINAQVRDSTTQPSLTADVIPNSYSTSPQIYSQRHEQKPIPPKPQRQYHQQQERQQLSPNIQQQPQRHHIQKQEQHTVQKQEKPATPKPQISFYTTSPPKTNAPAAHQSNYYQFEPQTVSTVQPIKESQHQGNIVFGQPKQPGQYFLTDVQDQYREPPPPNFDLRNSFQSPPPQPKVQYVQPTEPTTPRTTVSSTTPKASTYPNQLLETHNPYSINQAFQFSTPLDYHNLFEENYATPAPEFPQQTLRPTPNEPQLSAEVTSSTPTTTHKPIAPVTDKIYQTSPNYLQNNYSPEIHYESELANTRYQVTNNNNQYTTKSEGNEYSVYTQTSPQDNNYSVSSANPSDYPAKVETQSLPVDQQEFINNTAESDTATKSPYYQYESNYEVSKETSPTSSTTTTTTRRTPIRNRGRPRYTTPKADSNESTSRTVASRRPLKERRPSPSRTRYEPNKITTERATRKPVDSDEVTTKYSRSRTRGRVQYRPTESDEYYKSSKASSSKENDLAYQRDVLHQNYPVTIMERSSTHDIEAITEPLPRISSTKLLEPVTEVYDTENAYSNDRAAVSPHIPNIAPISNEEVFTSRYETQTETNIPKLASSEEVYNYQSRSSLAPVDAISQYDEVPDRNEDYGKQTTESFKPETMTEPTVLVTEQSPSSYSISDTFSKTEEEPTTSDQEITKVSSHEITKMSSHETTKMLIHETTTEEEVKENVIQTTPSYNRVRVRPGVVRQYHQASSTESPKQRRPAQPVTYRPSFDRRRTTMRIEEIEADLKTKPLHSRPEQDYRHPVYRPEPTTQPPVTASNSQETNTKRGAFRRRRPAYTTTTTSTEASTTSATAKRTFEVKNRFRGRRPSTEKTSTEKHDIQTDAPTTQKSFNRYTRPRFSERFNKKPVVSEPQDSEDQESEHSITRPKYVEPETDRWSTDSFKPFNPNEISDDRKSTTSASNDDSQDIITIRNDYDDILLTVTPASNNNNRAEKKIPDIPPTLEALVEQSKTTSTGDNMSTFETMLDEVMKSLDEQDENEYTKNVMKHKGGEIGEIPPERIISSDDSFKSTTVEWQDTTETTSDHSAHKEGEKENSRRRGFWKKVKVRPATTETIEAAESQHYANTVNRLGQPIADRKAGHDKFGFYEKPKVTTYKPAYQFLKNIFEDPEDDVFPNIDFMKLDRSENKTNDENTSTSSTSTTSTTTTSTTTANDVHKFSKSDEVFDMDLGTSSPDSTLENLFSTSTEVTTKGTVKTNRNSGFSFMDYLFGTTADDETQVEEKTDEPDDEKEITSTTKTEDIIITTEQTKPRLPTTESTYIPEEITESPTPDEKVQINAADIEIKKESSKEEDEYENASDKSDKTETSSVSSYMNPDNVISTSMSTEISHETEICFRGKCIKTSKDIL